LKEALKYVFTGLAIGFIGSSGISWYLGNEAYIDYQNAVTTSQSIEYRNQSQKYDVIKFSTGGVGLGFSILAIYNWFREDKRPEINQKIAIISNQISELEAK